MCPERESKHDAYQQPMLGHLISRGRLRFEPDFVFADEPLGPCDTAEVEDELAGLLANMARQADIFFITTRHPERYMPSSQSVMMPANVCIGAPILAQRDVDQILPILRQIPAPIRYILGDSNLVHLDFRDLITHVGRTKGCRICDPMSPSSCDQVVHRGIDIIVLVDSEAGALRHVHKSLAKYGAPVTSMEAASLHKALRTASLGVP